MQIDVCMNKKFNFWKPDFGSWTFDSPTGSFIVNNSCSYFHERSITKHAFNSKMIIECDSLLQQVHKTRDFQIYLGKPSCLLYFSRSARLSKINYNRERWHFYMICMDSFVYFTETKSFICYKLWDVWTITIILILIIWFCRQIVNTLNVSLSGKRRKNDFFKILKYQLFYFSTLKEISITRRENFDTHIHNRC